MEEWSVVIKNEKKFCQKQTIQFNVKEKKKKVALAGNRTRVNCLEGSYAHHYTTNAHTKVDGKLYVLNKTNLLASNRQSRKFKVTKA